MVFMIYLVIYLIIKTIFAKEYGIKCLKMQAYLSKYLYKIRVISIIRV